MEHIGGYELIAELTRGITGRVVLAQAEGSTETVAIKEMLIERESGLPREEQIARFKRESEIHLSLNHPNIVRAIEAHEDGDRLFLVQEYQPGNSWHTLLQKGDYTIVEVLELGVQLCDALHAMHNQGIVHRDITPSNLLISPAGQLKITDFGMARRAFAPGITQAKMMLGTLNYMSPEQLLDATAVDGRTDVFAAGVILYRSLVGQLPFAAENPSDMAHRLLYAEPTDPLELNPDLPKSLSQKLLKCLAKDPDFRYLSAESFRKDLEEELQNPELYLAQGKVHARQGQHKEAIHCLQHAVAMDNTLTEAWACLGESFYQDGQQERASECFLRVIHLDPSNAHVFRRLGASYFIAKNIEASLKMYQRAWTLEPQDRETCLALAVCYRELGRPQEAIEQFTLLTQQYPNWDKAFHEIGRLYYQDGRLHDALKAFEQCVTINPHSQQNLYNLASLYQEVQQEVEAEPLYRRLLLENPNHTHGKHNLACVLYGQGELEEAEDLLREVVEAEPTWTQTLMLLALVEESNGHLQEAEAHYRKVMEMTPEDTSVHLQLANVLQKCYRPQAAIEVLEQALALEDENKGVILLQLALAYRTSGNFSKALELSKVVPQHAQDPELSRAASKLEQQLRRNTKGAR